MDFSNVVSKIIDGVKEIINLLFKLPDFIGNVLNTLPNDFVIIISIGVTILVILLIYRFIK